VPRTFGGAYNETKYPLRGSFTAAVEHAVYCSFGDRYPSKLIVSKVIELVRDAYAVGECICSASRDDEHEVSGGRDGRSPRACLIIFYPDH
jgi:hypothetical protein